MGWSRNDSERTIPVFNKLFYNVRGQLSDIRVSTYSITTANKETDWNRGAVLNHFSYAVWGGSDNRNNGNVRTQQTWIPSDDQISGFTLYEQFYTYDSLNRVSSVAAKATNGSRPTSTTVGAIARLTRRRPGSVNRRRRRVSSSMKRSLTKPI